MEYPVIPKSLHTVTILVQLTRHLYETREQWTDNALSFDQCLLRAIDILGYTGAADIHGLTLQALKKLHK